MQETEGNADGAAAFDFSAGCGKASFMFWITKSRENSCQCLSVNKFTPWNAQSYKYCGKSKKMYLHENTRGNAFATHWFLP